MNHENLDQISSWFIGFVRKYDTSDELITTNLRYKEVHSFQVARICRIIACSLHMTEEEIIMAEIIGILHDTGRFPQFKKYHTFKDSISENHASLGVCVLKEEKVLNGLTDLEQEIILSAIQNHNRFILEPTSTSIDLFSKIIRDADKLDIYRFILESEEKRLQGQLSQTILLDLDLQPTFSESMLISILNNRCCLYSDLKTIHDFKLLQLSWVYDINFPITFQMLQEKNYIEKLCSLLPDEENIQLLTDHVKVYITSQITSQNSQKISEELYNSF